MPDFVDNMFAALRSKKIAPTKSAGVGGTAVYGGYVQSVEKNPKLNGRERFQTYGEILANTSIVAAGTRYFLGLLAKAAWKVEPAEGDNGEVAEFVEDVLFNMTTPWSRVVRRTGLYRFYGFSVQEWTAKMRDDGRVGLLDIEARPQITIERWDLDRSGTVHGVVQRSPQTQTEIYLPRSKLVYAVDDSVSDSPEGLGLFRHCVEAAVRLQRYEQLEGFAFETDLRGIPVGRVPFALLEQYVTQGKLSPTQKAAIEQPMKDFLAGHIRNPQLGLLLDSMTYASQDEAGTPSQTRLWDMELMKGDGSNGMEPVANAIERLNREIARVLGVENLLLGEKGAGSLALSRDKSNNFAVLVDGTLDELAQVYQKDIIEPLLELNGIDRSLAPLLKTDRVQFREVEQVTAALKDMAQAGSVLPPDDPAVNEVRDMLGLSRQDPLAAAEFAMSQLPAAPNEEPDPNAKEPQ